MALAGVAQLVGALSHNQNVAGSKPGQGTYPGCELIPHPGACNSRPGHIQEAPNQCFSLAPMFLPLPSSLSKSNEKKCIQVRVKKKNLKVLSLGELSDRDTGTLCNSVSLKLFQKNFQ